MEKLMTAGESKPRRIIVRAPNWVGDAVMATPFFSSLRETVPGRFITCLCRPMVADVFRYHPAIDEVRLMDESRGRSGWDPIRQNASLVREGRFDLAISLPNSLSAALIFFLAGIPERVGYRGDWRLLLLTKSYPFPAKGRRLHRTDGYLRLLRLVSAAPTLVKKLSLTIPEGIQDESDSFLAERSITQPFLTIAPGAAQPNKMWFPERFAELLVRLSEEGMTTVTVGGPSEVELCNRVVEEAGLSATFNLAGTGSLLHTAAVISRSVTFVGNDSGLAHIAAAVKTPVVVLSGPGDPREVAPYTDRVTTIAKSLFCKPCYKNVCWRKDVPLECLKKITVEDVCQACRMHVFDQSR